MPAAVVAVGVALTQAVVLAAVAVALLAAMEQTALLIPAVVAVVAPDAIITTGKVVLVVPE